MSINITINKTTSNRTYFGDSISLSREDVEFLSRVLCIPGYKVFVEIKHQLTEGGVVIQHTYVNFCANDLSRLKFIDRNGGFYVFNPKALYD